VDAIHTQTHTHTHTLTYALQVKATPKRASVTRATSPDSHSVPEGGAGTGDLSPMRRRTHWLLLGRETELRVVTQCIRVAGRVGGGGRVVMIEVC
jgi:hypothetical protein